MKVKVKVKVSLQQSVTIVVITQIAAGLIIAHDNKDAKFFSAIGTAALSAIGPDMQTHEQEDWSEKPFTQPTAFKLAAKDVGNISANLHTWTEQHQADLQERGRKGEAVLAAEITEDGCLKAYGASVVKVPWKHPSSWNPVVPEQTSVWLRLQQEGLPLLLLLLSLPHFHFQQSSTTFNSL